jgi:methylated-DNA-[protein]-cysteine S-methyltransferase
MYTSTLDTPIGKLVINANDQEVFFVGFPEEIPDEMPNDVSRKAQEQFRLYFEGKLHVFNFPLRQPGTEFQQSVWQELTVIPAGYPISYAQMSRNMNNPLAIRAIASANGKNNLMIVVPCHRVIGSNGDLVGFGGGLWRKKWLLDHESKMLSIGQASLEF